MAGTTEIEIRNTSNEVVTSIDPQTLAIDNTTTSINLFGKGIESYLKEVNENFYALLENFASTRAPSNPQIGQLWYSKKGTNSIEVKGTGLNYNAGRSIKINGINKSIRNRRGIALMIFNNTFTNTIKFVGYYDTYGSNAARTQLARKLDTVGKNEMFIMTSYDAIGTNKSLNVMMDKLGSHAWHKVKRSWRYPYTAIGTGTFGIISEDLHGYDDKTHAYSYLSFESLLPTEGMGPHTSLTSASSPNDNLLVWNGESWGLTASTIDGRNLKSLRTYILSGVDLSVKFDKSGGTINGSVILARNLIPKKDILPTGNEIQDLGTSTKRYRTLHLSENASISMGVGKSFNKNSFVYTVEKETDSVTRVPAGSLILNRATGEATVKTSNFVASTGNNTFGKLSRDKLYGVVIGGNNFAFNGYKGIWMGSWRHGVIQSITIPSPGNSTRFGSCRVGGHSAGASDGTRGLSFHQHNYSGIQYVTIATPMNAVNFGLFHGGWQGAGASDGTRALVLGGRWHLNYSHYVLFSTPMNSTKWGTLNARSYWNGAASDGSKAVFDQGAPASTNQYRYVSLSTPGNALFFGRMSSSMGHTGAASNGVHGLWAGGWNAGSYRTSIQKLTLVSPSNSTHFGTLSYVRHSSTPVSDDSHMVAAGGNRAQSTLDYVSFASGGNATVFGSLTTYVRYAAYFSGN